MSKPKVAYPKESEKFDMKTKGIMIVLILLLSNLVATSFVFLRAEAKSNGSKQEQESWFYSAYDLENFTIVVLPDTQVYSEKYPWVFDSQTEWIAENSEPLNIVFVTHLGDLVEHWDSITEWENANRSMSKLDNKVPWGVSPGNHDGFDGNLTNFDEYFGYNRFKDESWYAGAYEENNTNSYQLFSVGREGYLIFHLQYSPNDDVLAWVNTIINEYPNRWVIISTHRYMVGHGTNELAPDGERIWERIVEPHADQVMLVLSGHLPEEEKRTDIVDGNPVHQLLIDYQSRENGGNGWLRILEFSPSQNKIFVKTFSPYLKEFERDSNSEFTLDLNRPRSNDNSIPFHFALIPILFLAIVVFEASYLIHKRHI